MSILILSPDDVAAQSLGSALERRGIDHHRSTQDVPGGLPLVAVLDVAALGYSEVLHELRSRGPWTRCYLIADRGALPHVSPVPTIQKPFDAPAIADLLVRELALAESDRRRHNLSTRAKELGLLLQSSFEAIIGLDANGKIVFWNRGAEHTYGYSEKEALGQQLSFLGGDCALDKSEPHGPREVLRRHRQGHEVLVLVSRSSGGERLDSTVITWAEVSLDVTEKRALEREVEHGKRLAQVGRMAATLSHEINNPLAVIRSNAAWLAVVSREELSSEIVEVAADLEAASERIATFVDLMTGFARRGSTQLEHAPLKRSLDLALRMTRPRAESHRVDLECKMETADEVPVPHDPTRFAHAVINVVSNAIDAASQGGRKVWLAVSATNEQVCVEILDNGPGISGAVLSQVFEPFFTTKAFGQGTGLGLWLTRQIVTEHSGEISITPRQQGGTRVLLSLPRKRGAA